MFVENLTAIKIAQQHLGEKLSSVSLSKKAIWSTAVPSPTLIFDSQYLSSGYDRIREASLQSQLISEEAKEATIYGFGSGDLPRLLLTRPQLEELNIVILNWEVARASLEYFDHTDYLGDLRINLLWAADETELRSPFTVIPPCLHLATSACWRVRDMVTVELGTPRINQNWDQVHNVNLYSKRVSSFIARDQDVSRLFNTLDDKVLVVGGGPSIDSHIDIIKKHRKNWKIVAVNSALKPLKTHRVNPDVVIVIEALDYVEKHFDFSLEGQANTPLVYMPTVPPKVLERWPGPRFATYKENEELFAELKSKYPRGSLFCSGSVTLSAVDLALKMGATEVLFIGLDFSFPGKVSHAKNIPQRKEIKASVGTKEVLGYQNQLLLTSALLIGHLRSLEHYLTHHKDKKFWNLSDQGAQIQGAPVWPGE